MKAVWKQPDGEGGFNVIHHETSADVVKYGSTTVAEYLDSLPTASSSTFAKKLLTAKDESEAREILGVTAETFFDEGGARWFTTGPFLTDEQVKFAPTAVYCSGTGYLKSQQAITLGGSDFTIAFWAYIPAAKTATNMIFGWGNANDCVIAFIDVSNKLAARTKAGGSNIMTNTTSERTCEFTAGTWNHVEIDYQNSSGKFYLFFNGSLIQSGTDTNFQTARAMPFFIGCDATGAGNFTGYIDDFFITKKCLHTATFTPPTAPYPTDDKTLALLHFGTNKLVDETGARWYNFATTSSAQKKFGTKSLYCNASCIQSFSKLTLGGKDFTIAGWVYIPSAKTAATAIFNWGTSDNKLHVFVDKNNHLTFNTLVGGSVVIIVDMSERTCEFAVGTWNHVELDYENATGTLRLFFNGELVMSGVDTSFQTARAYPFFIGCDVTSSSVFTGYVDNFLITEQLLHDADFTPPTSAYEVDDNTLALLNFD